MKFSFKSLFKHTLFGVRIVGIALLLALILRLFVFSSFKIPTGSMSPAILPGDYILVNKLAYGARIPKNLDFMEGGKFETFRVKGFSKVKRNDVIVFNFPYSNRNQLGLDLNVFFAKRCVAIPRDTFYIENGIYKVKNVSDTLGNYLIQEKFSHKRESDIPEDVFRCFPKRSKHNEPFYWTLHNFGPLYVPGKNDCIPIDSTNIALYENLIEYETQGKVSVKEGIVCLNDTAVTHYTFRKNYYFMAGDYVPDSRDSRYWGLLPEDHIVGKAAIIWKSEDMKTKKYRWKRFFKTIK
jgi:signal peptidase I